MLATQDFDTLKQALTLGEVLSTLTKLFGGYAVVAHYTQGEFHHDLLLQPDNKSSVLVVATNCNGGVKELLEFSAEPKQYALWHHRCPDNDAFAGELPELLQESRTLHWFDPRELLAEDARSELRVEFRERDHGGGWRTKHKH